jgi:hypothetical protein
MKEVTIKNRYNDEYIFSLDDENNILWEGPFKYCRFSWPNDYTEAYNKYVEDNCDSSELMTLGEFKTAVHERTEDGHTDFAEKYMIYIRSDISKIDMVDPSGGPYIYIGMDMGYIDEKFDGMVIKGFKVIETGYKILIKKEND